MFRRNIASLQCDTRSLPLHDESVDLIVTSPPLAYFALRDYRDGGESVRGQVGNEPTPQAFLASMWEVTEEWKRVLKPTGSIFVNLGDKYDSGTSAARVNGGDRLADGRERQPWNTSAQRATTGRPKSLMGLPWRYALGCVDHLGMTLREEIIWDKPNGLPESVRDRCRRSHEQVFHLTKNPHYYHAVDRIREEHSPNGSARKGKTWEQRKAAGEPMRYGDTGTGASGAMAGAMAGNPAGKLPPTVWNIPTDPLIVPKHDGGLLGLEEAFDADHYAAFPPALVQRIILGWSPQHVCTACGQGRFPVTHGAAIVGNACACTPYVDHPENRGRDWRGTTTGERAITGQRMAKEFQRNSPEFQGNGHPSRSGGEWKADGGMERNEFGRAPVREYLWDQWQPASTVPGVVLDPFGGTGTTAIVAAILGRRGITCDLSFDYAGRLVPWRMNDRAQMRKLLGSKS